MADDHEQVLHNTWRLDALDRWRNQQVEKRLEDLEQRVAAMTTADEIARAVADQLQIRRATRFTLAQKLGGGLVGVIALADFVRGVLGL